MYSDSRRRIVGINMAKKRLVVERRDGVASTPRAEAIRWVEVDGVRVDVTVYINCLLGVTPYPGQPPLSAQLSASACPWGHPPQPVYPVYGYLVEGPGKATIIHPHRHQAETEALRLANNTHGVGLS